MKPIENSIARPPEGKKETCDICNGTSEIETPEQIEEIIYRNPTVSASEVELMEEEIDELRVTKCLNCYKGMVRVD